MSFVNHFQKFSYKLVGFPVLKNSRLHVWNVNYVEGTLLRKTDDCLIYISARLNGHKFPKQLKYFIQFNNATG